MTASFIDILGVFKQDMLLRTSDLDVVSSNIANMNTTGYKSARSNFQEVLESISTKGGSIINSTQTLTQQGSIVTTDNPYDLAIQGEGYLSVILPDGTNAYTRDGHLQVVEDENGNLRVEHSSGYLLDVTWDSGSLPTNEEPLTITNTGEIGRFVDTIQTVQTPLYDADGNLVVDGDGNIVMTEHEYTTTEFEKLGSFNLTRFANPGGLRSYGENMFVVSENSGEPVEGAPGTENLGTIKTSALEQSTVDLGEEMTHLISLQRGLTLSARGFQTTDTMISQAIQMRR